MIRVKSLTESLNKKYSNKKPLIEEVQPLDEGYEYAHCSYEGIGKITDVSNILITDVEKNTRFSFQCDAKGVITEITLSVNYGEEEVIDDCEFPIVVHKGIYYRDIDDNDEFVSLSQIETEILAILVGEQVKIDEDEVRFEGWNIDIIMKGAEILDDGLIDYMGRLAHDEPTYEQYDVIDEDGPVEGFTDKEEAIQFAKENNCSKVVLYQEWWSYNERQFYDDYSETVWENDELEESYSLTEKVNRKNIEINTAIQKALENPNNLDDSDKQLLKDKGVTIEQSTDEHGHNVVKLSVPGGNEIIKKFDAYDDEEEDPYILGPTDTERKHRGQSCKDDAIRFDKYARYYKQKADNITDKEIDDYIEDKQQYIYDEKDEDYLDREIAKEVLRKNYLKDAKRYRKLADDNYKQAKYYNSTNKDNKHDSELVYIGNIWGPGKIPSNRVHDREICSGEVPDKIDYYNYLSNKKEEPINRFDKQLGNNDTSSKYTNLSMNSKLKKSDLTQYQQYNPVLNDDELSEREDIIRKRIMAQLRNDLGELHDDNERHREITAERQAKYDDAEKERMDFLKSNRLAQKRKK